MELELLKCGECGKTYIASSLPKDSVRFKCICDDCREVSFGKPFIVADGWKLKQD